MRRPSAAAGLLAAALAAPVWCASALAGPPTDDAPMSSAEQAVGVDSGWVTTSGPARGAAWSTVVSAPGRRWMRLVFDEVSLGRTPVGGEPTVIRITGLLDGATQHLTTERLAQWQGTSAYFNGEAVRVEIIADPSAPPSRVRIASAWCQAIPAPGEGGTADICGGLDDRVPTAHPAIGRMMPQGCTVWLFDDANRTLLSAGHCGPLATTVIQFNVPLSDSSGVPVAPPPADQYAPDLSSGQRQSGGEGFDWSYFGCFPNTETGLTPYQAQGAFFATMHAPSVEPPGQELRITGMGWVEWPGDLTLSFTPQTSTGPYTQIEGSRLSYLVDTQPGNSGSPVVDTATGAAIGIHTHGGCEFSPAVNMGTAFQNAAFQYALATPRGVCVPSPPLSFSFPDGLPESVALEGGTIRVVVGAGPGGEPQPGTGMLHLGTPGDLQPIPMVQVKPNVYDAVLPAQPCGTVLRYFVSATAQGGAEARHPAVAPAALHEIEWAAELDVPFMDRFETDLGWTVESDPGVTTGSWERAAPTATGPRVPTRDGDGSGVCFVTDNAQTADLDGGATRLISPVFEVAHAGTRLRYWRWFSTSSIVLEDTLTVEISIDGGATWLPVETYTSTSVGWFFQDIALDSIAGFAPSPTCRVRFTADDTGDLSAVEAGVDGFEIRRGVCASCPADLDGDGAVSGADLGLLLSAWGTMVTGGADLDDDGTVGGADLGLLLAAWGDCPGAP